MTRIKTCWTLVQHSGYGYGGNEGFAQGLELRSIETVGERNRVLKAGGVIYDDYEAAMVAENNGMYPKGYEGIYPNAQGTFSDKEVDGLKIYIPDRTPVGA